MAHLGCSIGQAVGAERSRSRRHLVGLARRFRGNVVKTLNCNCIVAANHMVALASCTDSRTSRSACVQSIWCVLAQHQLDSAEKRQTVVCAYGLSGVAMRCP